MKTFQFLKPLLTIAILLGLLATSALDQAYDPDRFRMEKTEQQCDEAASDRYIVVRALLLDGEVVPVIDLPVVEITADIPTHNLVSAGSVDGKLVPMVILDEVVITPGS